LEKAESLLERMPHAEVLYVDYAHVVENAAEVAETVAEFLGEDLDTIKMAAAVDKNLYRNKSAVSHA